MKHLLIAITLIPLFGQTPATTPAPKRQAPAAAKKALAAAPPAAVAPPAAAPVPEPGPIDAIIALSKANLSESLMLKMVRRQAKGLNLSPADVLKLQKGGVPEKIIEVLLDPEAETAAQPPAPPPSAPVSDFIAPVKVEPQPAVAIVEPEAKKEGNQLGKRIGDRFKLFGKKQAEKAEKTLETTVDNSLTSAEASANKTMDKAQAKTEQSLDKSLGATQAKTGQPVSKSPGGTQPKPATKK